MAEAVGAIAAVNGTINSINIVKGWIGSLRETLTEWEDVGDILQDLHNIYQDCEGRLRRWAELWRVGKQTTRRFQRALWGKHGLEKIARDLTSINGLLQTVWEKLAGFSTEFNEVQLVDEENSSKDTWLASMSAAASRDQAKRTKKALSLKDKAGLVFSKVPKMRKELTAAKEKIDLLDVYSLKCYVERHKTTTSTMPSNEEFNDIYRSIFLDQAAEARVASRSLYDSCYAANEKRKDLEYIKLEMDLSRERYGINLRSMPQRTHIAVQYHLLLPQTALFVENSWKPEQTTSSEGFLSALDAAISGTPVPDVFGIRDRPEAGWFRSRTPSDEERITTSELRGPQMKPIEKLLYDLIKSVPRDLIEEFPCAQRLQLAFKIAECGLLLAGTTWLSKLSARGIHRAKKIREASRFVLETEALKKRFDDNDPLRLEQQIYAIGILLVELGTGQLVREVKGSPSVPGGDPEFTIYDPSVNPETHPDEGMEIKEDEIRFWLICSMGDKYTGAAMHCLTRKEEECWMTIRTAKPEECEKLYSEKAYREALGDYYCNVYLPLQTLGRQGYFKVGDE